MELDPSTITFASLLTPEGIVAGAALITAMVALIKAVFPVVEARVSGALLAFVLSAILYALAASATGARDLDAFLAVVVAWVSCATSAVGIHSATVHTVKAVRS